MGHDLRILTAHAGGRLQAVRLLFREYETELAVDLRFQNFEAELAGLPGAYAPPGGGLWLAVDAVGRPAGCVALRDMGDGVCEMKRLYVRPFFRGSGLGRRLAVHAVDEARARGYARMRLDTLDRLEAAMALYRELGFREREPYYANPLPGVVYWEADLAPAEPPAPPEPSPVDEALRLFAEGRSCSQAVLLAFAPRYGLEDGQAARLAACLGSGMRVGGVCGAMSGAYLVLGLAFGGEACLTREGRGELAPTVDAFAANFRERVGAVDCPAIVGCDLRTDEGRARSKEQGLSALRCAPAVRAAAELLEELLG